MQKSYTPAEIETKWYQDWEQNNYFAPKNSGQPFCIMLPPPNVTGSLHMGHAFQDTIMDILIRYHRMRGYNTLWQLGTDHAGIATQMVVERQLQQQSISRHDLGREKFIKKIWQWKDESGGTIASQLRRLGTSGDWQREQFTMNPQLCEAVQEVFIRLYDEGLIYRGERLVNWDPVLLTAISDLEVVTEEEDGKLYFISYPLVDSNEMVTIATTRPETMLGDVAVAVNPEDERFKHLIGKNLKLPLTNRIIPIIADAYVQPEFGTGCVKITPAHDFNDYEIGKRHNLGLINIFTPEARITPEASAEYHGLDRFEARKRIVLKLEELNLLAKIEPHKLKVPRGDRTNVIIEPYLTPQWFVKIDSLAQPAIDAVKQGKIKFVPENWSKTYYNWMENIEDWCISRQLWWGHRIPAWYDADNNIYVGRTEAEVRSKYNLGAKVKLQQDADVLDTWFSSALWPFSTLGWPKTDAADLKTFYPTSVLVTGFDIIFFWVARMIMMGLKFTGDIPFHTVYIHGLIQDQHGKKMSKSKGNVIDPIDLIDGISLDKLIEKRTKGLMQPHLEQQIIKNTKKEFPDGIAAHGTDALRFTYASLASNGRHIRFELNRLESSRNFCNKLWNASRYVFMHVDNQSLDLNTKHDFSDIDQWIQAKLNETINKVNQAFTSYRFDFAAQAIYEFTWNEYCDWYIELSKPILNGNDAAAKQATIFTLVNVLEQLLRLSHPFMPFITEEIWQKTAAFLQIDAKTIMLQPYPTNAADESAAQAVQNIEWLKEFIIAIRTLRAELNVAPSKVISIIYTNASAADKDKLKTNLNLLQGLAKIATIKELDSGATPPQAATALVGDMQILLPLAGLVDITQESQRLQKEIAKLQQEQQRAQNKLANPNYRDKAPQDVVAKEEAKLESFNAAIAKLEQQLEQLCSTA